MNKIDWNSFDMAKVTQDDFDEFDRAMTLFFHTHTMAEIYEGANKRGMMLYPVATVEDMLKDPQLTARDFWQKVEHPELGATFLYPGAFIKASLTPLQSPSRAPSIGEHNQQVYGGELGLSEDELLILKQTNVI